MIKKLLDLLFRINKESKPNDLQECFDAWKQYRTDLINQKLELEKQIDKTVFTISTGAIGISLIILDKLFPEKGNIFLYLILGLGWACLVMSLIFQTISFVKTSKLIQTSIANIEKITVSTTLDEVATNEDEYYENWRKSNKKIDRGNKISFWFMLVGIFCIVLCAFTSLILKDKTSNQPFPEINIILKDTLTNNTYNMSKAKQSGDSSKKAPNNKQPNQVRNVKVVREGKLTVKQSQQIVAPPIKTNPKK